MFNFNFDFETYDVIFEVYIGDLLTNKQRMQAPKEMLIANFLQTVNQVKDDRRPIKVKMIRQEVVYDKIEKKQKVINNEIEFLNNACEEV